MTINDFVSMINCLNDDIIVVVSILFLFLFFFFFLFVPDFGLVLGNRLYIKEITNRSLIDKDASISEGDVIVKVSLFFCLHNYETKIGIIVQNNAIYQS